MPGQYRWGVPRLAEALDEAVAAGLSSVLLFGVLDDAAKKNATGSAADAPTSPVVRACRFLRARYPGLLIVTDLCLCAYTDHGHWCVAVVLFCSFVASTSHPHTRVHTTRHTPAAASCTLTVLSTTRRPLRVLLKLRWRTPRPARRYVWLAVVAAPCFHSRIPTCTPPPPPPPPPHPQMIAPSDMMDGRVGAIKTALREAGLGGRVPVMSYAAKFASSFYGPFRDAAHSGMSFGDRSLYQLPPAARGLALRAVDRDLAEGADFVMVKPGMPYLDIIRDTAERSTVPVAVYQVSGEFAMLYHAAAAGGIDLRKGVMESLTSTFGWEEGGGWGEVAATMSRVCHR